MESTNVTKDLIKNVCEFRFGPIKAEEYQNHLPFLMNEFLTREPIALGLHLRPEEMKQILAMQLKEWSASEVAVHAYHIPSNEIAGVLFSKILTRDDSKTFENLDFSKMSKEVQYNFDILSVLEKSVNLFEDSEGSKALEIAIVCVSKKFSGSGIGYHLVKEGEKLGLAKGCQLACAQLTGKVTQHMFHKMGYKVMYTLNYADYEAEGKKVLDIKAMEGTTKAEFVLKYLAK